MFTQEMPAMSEKETIGLSQCHTCRAELWERDKFCRRCGVSQRLPAGKINAAPVPVVTKPSDYATERLSGRQRSGSFSGALVNLLAQSVAEGAAPLRGNRWMMRLVGALAVVPLWLMIALLSPLEAYVAAKAIATRG
ncbi:MAG: hypothetical protein HOP19_28550 [Acidobacteria bacterium]|nr:hypothetical protein [Acidobacteriota bacterium]